MDFLCFVYITYFIHLLFGGDGGSRTLVHNTPHTAFYKFIQIVITLPILKPGN